MSTPTLTPLSNRVLIRPRSNPTVTDSGLHLSEHYKPEQIGTVISIGPLVCPTCASSCAPDFQVGDEVLFSWTVGQELFINGHDDRLLMLHAGDILAVVEAS